MRRADGGILALSRGRHLAGLRLDRSVAVVGTCFAETIVEAPTPSDTLGTVELVAAGSVVVRDLTITGPRPGLIARGTGADPYLVQSVLVSSATGYGIKAEAPQPTMLAQVGVFDTQPFADGSFGLGVAASLGAVVEADRLALRASRTLGVLVTGAGSRVALRDSRVGATLPQESDNRFGRGVNVGSGGRFEAAATVVEGNSSTGLFAIDAGSSLSATHLVVRGTLADARTGDFGRGIEVDTEATLDCTGCVIEGNHDAGLVVDDSAQARLQQTVVADNLPRTSDGRFGRGIMVQGGARVEASGLLVTGHSDLALYLSDTGSEAILADARVEGTTLALDRLVSIQAEAVADLQRVVVQGDATVSVYVGTGAAVSASDLQIAGSGTALLATSARLLEVSGGGSFVGARLALFAAAANGLLVSEPSSTAVLRDARFSTSSPTTSGRAIEVNLGGRATLERTLVDGFADAGAAVFTGGSSLVIRDAVISAVAGLAAPARGTGHALAAYDGASLEASRIVLRDAGGACLRVAGTGVVFDLDTVAFRRCFVGVNLEVPELSSDQLGEHLRNEQFAENGEDVASRTFAIPEPTTTLDPAP